MKKIGTLNSHLSRVIAQMGHSDMLVICDSGLPIPRSAEVVDLAVTKNVPSFMEVLKVVLSELQVESAVIATEMESANKNRFEELMNELNRLKVATVKRVPHSEFKEMANNGNNVAFVRTGEATPYANVILVGGVTFD